MVPDIPPSSAEEHPHPPIRDNRRLLFGDFELIVASGELFRRTPTRLEPVKLQPQPAKALIYLAERPGRLVTRAELQRHLWGEDHFVDYEQGLNYCVRAIRRALADDASDPRFLETIPRRGYRFRAPVEDRASRSKAVGTSLGDSLLRLARPTGRRDARTGRRFLLILIAVAISSVAAHWALSAGLLRPASPPKIAVLPFENHSGTDGGDALASSLTDELISQLASAHADRLGVIARNSSRAYAGRQLTAARIGRELDADYLLTGGMQASGRATRISVQLIRVRDETNVWAEIYDRPLDQFDQADWDAWVRAVSSEVADHLAPPTT